MSNIKNDVCKLQNIVYTLMMGSSSHVLDSGNVLDCQITWDVNDISCMGGLVFQDSTEIFSLIPPHASLKLSIKYKQYLSSSNTDKPFDFERLFSVTRIERGVKGSNKSMIKLEFIDVHYFYMSRRYKSKGYVNTKFSTILKDILAEDSTMPSINVSSIETEKTHDSIVVPANKSFIHFVYNMEYRDGFSLINDKSCFNIINASDYMSLLKDFSKASAITFTTNQDNPNNPFYIKEYKMLMLDSFANNSMLPNTVISHFDYANKGVSEKLILNDVLSQNLKVDDNPLVGSTLTIGFKKFEYHTDNFYSYVNRLHSFKLLETILLEITVSGNTMYGLYDIVNINITNPIDGITNANMLYSGNYIILKIVDKIEGTFFNQIITLGRVGVKLKL